MEAEASTSRSPFKLRYLVVPACLMALGAAAWQAGFTAMIVFVSFTLSGAIAYFVWLERRNAAATRLGQRGSAVIGGAVFLGGGMLLSFGGLLLLYPFYINAVKHRFRESENNMRQLAAAVRMYEAEHGPLPRVVYDEAGRPMHSWRVLILPQFREFKLYKRYRFEEPWNSPHTLTVAEDMPPLSASPRPRSAAANATGYLAVFSSAEENGNVGHLPLAETPVMLVEFPNSEIFWTEPRDLPLSELSAWQEDSSQTGGRLCATPQGGVYLIEPDTQFEFLPR